MAKKPTVNMIGSGYASKDLLNNNFTELRDAFDNTLSLDGSTPNAMGADLDMNGNDILNAGTMAVADLTVAGQDVNTALSASVAAAAASAAEATTSVTEAATSATEAAASAAEATIGVTEAATSATEAAASAAEATISATEAATSSTEAAVSSTEAAASATQAATSATEAATSATQAATSATQAATSATQAATSATQAATSSTEAAASATGAATSATGAATSATGAATSATEAAASAAEAAASAALPAEASSTTYTQGGVGSVQTTVASKLQETVSVKDYGAIADGVDTGSAFTGTDNTAAFQTALDAAGAAGAVLYVPAGKYRFAANTTADSSNLTLNNNVHIIEGYGAELLIDDDAGTHYSLLDFIRTPNLDTSTNLDDRELLQINGLTFRGRWSHSNYYAGSNVLTVQNFARIELNDVKAYDIPAKFSRSRYNGALAISGFEGKRIASDCIRFVDTPNVEITNINLFEIDDDCIALPVSNAALSDTRSRITISNATIEKCEGILILGARSATISNIAMRLCMGTHVYVGGLVGTEGVAAPHNLTLSNITITDPLNRADGGSIGSPPTAMLTSSNGAIVVAGLQPTDGTSAAKPEYYDSVAGAFVTPYQLDTNSKPIMYNYGTANTLTGGYNVVIDGCTVMRTLPAVANYSDWGLGLAFSRYGRYDPAVTINNWSTNGILLNGSIKNAVVSDCSVMGLTEGAGVFLQSLSADAASRNREFENIIVDGCSVRDCKYGVAHSATSSSAAFTWSVIVRDCSFDLDPFHTASIRRAAGGWQTGIAVSDRPVGVFFRQSYGWSIHGCSFANCYDSILANSDYFEQADIKDNILLCKPVAIGYNNNNLGIGDVPAGGEAFRHYIIDGDPTSSTYMQITTIPVGEANAKPTSGFYVKGHFVKNTNPQTSSSKTTIGWMRQSTGTGHTLATTATADWAPLVIPTS